MDYHWIYCLLISLGISSKAVHGFEESLVEQQMSTSSIGGPNESLPIITTERPTCPQNHYKINEECLLCGCARKRDCVSETGQCPENSCKRGRFGPGCVYGVLSIRNEKINPRQPTNVTCVIRTDNIDHDSQNLQLTTGSKPLTYHKPSFVHQDGDNQLEAVFNLSAGLLAKDNYTCYMKQADGQTLSRTFKASVYDLPALARAPEVNRYSFVSDKYTQLIIHRWDPGKGDSGDGPIESYVIKACQHSESQQCSVEEYPKNFVYMTEQPSFDSDSYPASLTNRLIPGAKYSFIYKAKRPGGIWGSGPPSPPLIHTIPCRKPTTGPVIHRHNYTMDLSGEWRKVNVTLSWQLPSKEHVRCNYISAVTVRFKDNDSNEMFTSVLDGSVTSLTSLLNPYSLYTVVVGYKNNANLDSTVDVFTMNRTLSAVAVEPQINNLYLVNGSVVKINWSEPIQPNGMITKYEVFYAEEHSEDYEVGCIANTGWLSLIDSYTCLIHNLQLLKTYNFKVRARNSAGYGDNSTVCIYKLEYQAPASVTTLTNTSKTDGSIYLTWSEPGNTGGLDVSLYKLTCFKGDFQVQYTVPLNTRFEQKNVLSFNVTKLEHSTRYTCHVVACNKEGCSNNTHDIKVYTNPPEPSAPAVPEFNEKMNTDSSIALELKPAQCCKLYRVIVMETKKRKKRYITTAQPEISTESPENCGKCCDSSCYIAAELPQEELPSVFIVGDNNSYNGFYNPALVTGREYKIWYGAGNIVDGVEKFEYVQIEQPVVAREYIGEQKPAMSSSALIGTIVAVCVCAVILILVLMFVLVRHRRNKMFRFRTPDSEKVLELNENGHLLPNGSYQKGDAVSVDSLDMSKQPNGEPVYDNVRVKNFPIMVEELREYIEQMSEKEGFKREYNLIPWGLRYSREVAIQPDNKLKNRYGNIIAYDHSRVVLKGKNLDQDTDYINANYIDGYKTPKEYIATQGPTKLTVNDLWHMAWQEGTRTIVMVTNTVESTRNKCEQYWPEKDFVQYGEIKVTVTHSKSLAHYKIRTFTMEKDGESRTLKQFHFTAWPDHGTPTHATTLLSFLKKVRQYKSEGDGPIICHCSAGVGRSGTFIALDSLLKQAELESKVNVYSYVTSMREQRCNMVQTLDQYIFLHDALLEASEGFDTIIPLSDFKSQYDTLRTRQSKGKSQVQVQYEKLQDLLYIDRSTDASSKENQIKNRCANVIPFNHRRVKLHNMPSDYINATFVDDHRKRMSLIATQHPLTSTMEDFWKMVELEKPFAVVTLCASSAVNDSKDKQDLPKFWPTMECRTKEYTSVSIELLEETQLDKVPGVTKQSLVVTNKNQKAFQPQPLAVDHYMCDFWSSQKPLPSNKESLLKLVSMLDRRKQENDDKTLVVNCYDGAKQTGLYLACHVLLQQLLMDSEVDVPEVVKLIRNDQPMFIPSVEQYQFCYDFVYEFLDKLNQDSAVFTHL